MSLVNFNLGDVYNSSSEFRFLGISVDTFFTVSFTLLAIFIAEFIKSQFDNGRRKRKLDTLKTFFKKNLESLDTPLQKQIIFLKEDAEKMRDFKTKNLNIRIASELTTMDLMDENGALKEYFLSTSKNLDEFTLQRKLRIEVQKISYFKNDINFLFKDFMEKYGKYENEWQKLAKQLSNKNDALITEATRRDLKLGDYPFLDKLSYIFTSWLGSETPERNIKQIDIVYEMLVKRIKSLCKEFIHDNNALQLNFIVVEMESNYKEIENVMNVYASNLDYVMKELEKTKEEIKNSKSL